MQKTEQKLSKAKETRKRADKKASDQLGAKHRTASHRLERKIFFSLLQETKRDTCCRCGQPLTEDSYSIDHMEHWLDSVDPQELFYNIKNIDFSCKRCNSAHNRGAFVKGGGRNGLGTKIWTVRKPLFSKDDLEPRKLGFFAKLQKYLRMRV